MIPFLKTLTTRPVKYLPNHVDLSGLSKPCHDDRATSDTVRLIYFGRLIADKGIALAIETCAELMQRGVPATLTLIGHAEAPYLAMLKQLALDRKVADAVTIEGPAPFDQVAALARKSHFFIFPTSWLGEGHSNSLTEAMAVGAVPLCSDWGCNASVVDDAGSILGVSATAVDYAEAIMTIWTQGEWQKLSRRCIERVQSLYTSEIVVSRLADMLVRIQ